MARLLVCTADALPQLRQDLPASSSVRLACNAARSAGRMAGFAPMLPRAGWDDGSAAATVQAFAPVRHNGSQLLLTFAAIGPRFDTEHAIPTTLRWDR